MNDVNSKEPKKCFVVMGFGIKTDYATGRELDLNKSYRLLIKPVVEGKNIKCVRADEILHSGSIDEVMYRELLTADVVIADLSTANPNALYELGIRHALRPKTTIVISENKLPYPFDLNHILITSYTHLGKDLDYDEVIRFQKVLGDMLDTVLQNQNVDSPVYTYLSQLAPPALGGPALQEIQNAEEVLEEAVGAVNEATGETGDAIEDQQNDTLATLIEQGEQAIKANNFSYAKAMFTAALALGKDNPDPKGNKRNSALSHDPYLIQRLVLATYKAKQPDEISALNEALTLLSSLNLKDSNDPETVGLAGAIEKRHFDNNQGVVHLNHAITYYGRGYYLRNSYYNAINLAYLLNLRSTTSLDPTNEEKIADLVGANRIRKEALMLCEEELGQIEEREKRKRTDSDQVKKEQNASDQEQKFWCLATMAEAYFGLGQAEAFNKTYAEVKAFNAEGWMIDSLNTQLDKLKVLLTKNGHLLNPPWSVDLFENLNNG